VKFKTATMLMMAVIAVSLAIPIAASGSAGGYPVGGPATYGDRLPALSPETKIEERHRALGLIGSPVAGPIKGPGESPQARATQETGFDWGDAGIGVGAAFVLTAIGLGGALALGSRQRREEGATSR
jgi:hypothetical protein